MSGLNISQLRTELRDHLGVDIADPKWTDPDCDLVLNRSFWEIQDKFKFKAKESRVTLAFLSGAYSQALSPSTLEAIQSVYVIDPDTNLQTQLRRLESTEFNNGSIFNSNFDSGTPESYYRENGTLYIHPVPDQSYNILLLYQATLTDLSNSNTSPIIPQSWHEIILFGGVWRGFVKLGDMTQSSNFRGLQSDLVSSAIPVESKEEVDSRFAGLYVYGYDGEL